MNRPSFISGRGARYLKYFMILVVVVIIGIVVKNVLASIGKSSSATVEKMVLNSVISEKYMGKDIKIPLTNEEGEEVDSLTMRIENVELRDEIIVQGQKATSVAGRGFLVVNLKLVNRLEQGVEVNTKDYIRLGKAGQEEAEWLAPDIHNDPVLIQAISTKPTRVAFPVNIEDKQYVLQVGEIAGEKERLEIDFSN